MNKMALNGLDNEHPLKVIVRGRMENNFEVAEVLFISEDKELIRDFYEANFKEDEYLMIYGVPYDTDLSKIGHYPSVAFEKDDFE
ncbi:hypothetical protein BG262_08880 [Floricoccus penangensis]|uniref:Uncharacterized protein n=1 Tax=Floricoccus penangensis TaxID=1859475 RepID=A0A9Q5JHT3_9LACT|nr:hypothetical protein [Floricoccus penangensis]OFI47794.1 hypothetical protein BG262_08880 [Floricoccus penangensis]